MNKAFNLILAFGLLTGFSACNSEKSENVSSENVNITSTAGKPEGEQSGAIITFEKEEHDFGKIIQGEVKSYSFKFKNTGSEDLIITNASASCGCTVPEVPKKPIAAGATDKIVVEFNSEGKSGSFDKTVTVLSNGNPRTKVLRIKGFIETPETK